MSRSVPFNEIAKCGGCGAIGAFDFMGDYFCADCAGTLVEKGDAMTDQPTTPTAEQAFKETTAMTRDEIRAKYQNDQNWPLQSFDAADWAKAFIAKFGKSRERIDESLMMGWFANALMRGYDEYHQATPTIAAPGDWPPYAEIYVGDGLFAICDWSDWPTVRSHRWNLSTRTKSPFYAITNIRTETHRTTTTMHQMILPCPAGSMPDHINGNGLDNRRQNLRVATKQQNAFNQRLNSRNNSGFRGVCWDRQHGAWRATIRIKQKRIHLGRFAEKIDAARAYNVAAKEMIGEFAKINDVD